MSCTSCSAQHQPHVLPSHQYLLDTTTIITSSNWWMMVMKMMMSMQGRCLISYMSKVLLASFFIYLPSAQSI
jgi:hypothetical protein